MNRGLKALLLVAGLGAAAWVVDQTIHAGADVPPPSSQVLTRLGGGSAGGKRLDGRSWSLDYGSATMTADGQTAEIDKIRDGLLLRNGKPFARMRADHVSANIASNSFTAHGPVEFTELGGKHRRIVTTDASYAGDKQTLTMTHQATISEGAATVVVQSATMNFATGATTLGRIDGTL